MTKSNQNNSSSFGVRTRAKTLALKTHNMTSLSVLNSSSLSYLQLRNRRLLRLKSPKKPHYSRNGNFTGNPNLDDCSSVAGCSPNSRVQSGNDDVIHGNCFRENVIDFDPKERRFRESTPSNMIQNSDAIPTPGSTTRPSSSAQSTRRLRSSTLRDIPVSHELDQFFADAEEKQQNDFIQKYNFDPVNGKPLPGRYVWEKVEP